MWWLPYLACSNSLKLQNSTQLISILHSNAEFSKLSKILLYSQTFGSHCPRWKYLPQKIHQGFNNVMERMKPKARGNENFIIISACYWDFLQVSFHCSISHQCPTGSTYWAFVGATHLNIMTVNWSALLHFTTLCM